MPNKKLIPSSFDVIGSKEKAVAIIEVPDEKKDRGKEVAEAILEQNKNVKSVLRKMSSREGEYRTRKYELLAGDKNTEVLHKEYGYMIKVDPQKAYFSTRELTERQRIAPQVKPKEVVMVMFSGVAPIAVAIGKRQPEVERVIAVEINPDAARYADENIRINKLGHKIISMPQDVRLGCVKWYGRCDRVVMPLPMAAESFLDIAVNCLKQDGGTVHFYNWGKEPEPFGKAEEVIKEELGRMKRKYEIINRKRVLPYAPGKWKVCIDFRVKK